MVEILFYLNKQSFVSTTDWKRSLAERTHNYLIKLILGGISLNILVFMAALMGKKFFYNMENPNTFRSITPTRVLYFIINLLVLPYTVCINKMYFPAKYRKKFFENVTFPYIISH